jgi:hypothetical protein
MQSWRKKKCTNAATLKIYSLYQFMIKHAAKLYIFFEETVSGDLNPICVYDDEYVKSSINWIIEINEIQWVDPSEIRSGMKFWQNTLQNIFYRKSFIRTMLETNTFGNNIKN